VPSLLNQLAQIIGVGVVGLGGVTALAFALFRIFGEKWLNNKFEEGLAQFKHEQQKEMERIRLEINSLMDRRVKLYNNEFEIIPVAWEKLHRSYFLAASITSSFQQYSDLNKMTEPQLESFLEKTELLDWQKIDIRNASDKTNTYIKFEDWRRFTRAAEASNDSFNYIKNKGLFIEDHLKTKFDEISKLISNALFEYQTNQSHQLPYQNRLHEALDQLPKSGQHMLDELELELKRRLWNAEVNETYGNISS
jgi:hypothetical protein